MFIRLSALAAALTCAMVVSVALAATPTPSTTATTTATPTPPSQPVPDAAVMRDSLLTLALGNLDALASSTFLGAFPAWVAAYPDLSIDGSAVLATEGHVSVRYNYLNSKGANSATNPDTIAFAVGDAAGRCRGAVLYGFPKIDKSMKLDTVSPCTAEGAIDAFAAVFNATPTATASGTATPSPTVRPTAPLPPATGSGTESSGPALWLLLAGTGLVFAGGGAYAARRGR